MTNWQVSSSIDIPAEFITAVRSCKPSIDGRYAAQLLWQRGMRDIDMLAGYLDGDRYQPQSPFAFGAEMSLAVERLADALSGGEKVAIWGDFDADGVTATSVLWDGLGQFFARGELLSYYIPDRMRESHGLNIVGIDRLAAEGVKLIVTCDTGSTNIKEIEYATKLGIDTIVTDHHTLPLERPPATAIINPRYFGSTHPLFHLSGVAVAYKLVEGLYEHLPNIPRQPIEYLLDLVAIGLIADLVQLKGDCRYLAQQGIKRLTLQNNPDIDGFRPGVHKLLKLCKSNGDRPTHISFGIAPRINAISRIHGDARFGVELLTSQDIKLCESWANDTELANTRRKEVQKNTTIQVQKKLAELDLSTTSVIVLVDANWSPGVLGLVAGQIAQEHGKPTILLSTIGDVDPDELAGKIARGSARSIANIDLYQLVNSQSHLLNSFGGHPFAAGLSIDIDKIPLFTEAINRELRCSIGELPPPSVQIDLVITCADLHRGNGRALFEELLLLEPYGMGNPVPKLLVKNCRFDRVQNRNIKDFKGNTVRYIRTTFEIVDNSTDRGFPGLWWGHPQDDIPRINCDAIVELDYNSYDKRFEVRLVEVRPAAEISQTTVDRPHTVKIWDFRQTAIPTTTTLEPVVWVAACPSSWSELRSSCQIAIDTSSDLALNYHPTELATRREICDRLIGIAKYLAQTKENCSVDRLKSALGIGDRSLRLGLEALTEIGFDCSFPQPDVISILQRRGYANEWRNRNSPQTVDIYSLTTVKKFLDAIAEAQFRQNYFHQVPAYAISAGLGINE
jgi:single-stranded-DNA-specific exonuclease